MSEHNVSASRRRTIAQLLFERVDSLILVVFRVAVGVALYFWAESFLVEDKYIPIFIEPRFRFKYPGFEWVRMWPGDGIYWHLIIAKVAAFCLTIGFLTRLSAAILCATVTYVLLVDCHVYVNHYYLLACAAGLLVFLPAGRRYSIDSASGIERRERTMDRWQLWLMRFQLGIPYVFGAIAKLNSDWLSGQPAQLILSERTHYPVIGPYLDLPGMTELFSYGGLFYDLLVVPMLLFKPTRLIAVGLSLVFHLTNAHLLNIGVFPWFMLATLVVFFPAETVPNLARRLRGMAGEYLAADVSETPQERMSRTWVSRLGFRLACLYVIIQLLLPVRPWLLPGDASWNERGHRFAWRMMLRDKETLTHFLVVDPINKQDLILPSTAVMTAYQSSRAERHPDLIRQAALELKKKAAELGVPNSRVYALALVSMNGRQPMPLVDPTVDLTQVKRGWFQDDWVTREAGEFKDPPWRREKEQWWVELDLPEPFKRLQGRTPEELRKYLARVAEVATAAAAKDSELE